MSLVRSLYRLGTIVNTTAGGPNRGPWGSNKGTNGRPLGDFFDGVFGKGTRSGQGGGSPIFSPGSRLVQVVLVLLAICVWLSSGLYVIQPDEEGVELRFGKYLTTTMPGLHYHLPAPIDRVFKIGVTNVQRMEIGYRSASARGRPGDLQALEQESLLLTKDENIVDTNFEIQWYIKNVKDYLFNFRGDEISTSVRNAAESAIREIIGRQGISTLLEGDGRTLLSDELRSLLQSLFDAYGMGIHVISIQVKKVDPPKAVIDAFRDVQSARADKERMVNLAFAYSNDIIPRARGEAAAIVNEAMAYKQESLHKASGESKRFLMVYREYKASKDLTRDKIYLDTVDGVFSDLNKVIVDKSANPMYYLPLSELIKHKKE